MSCSSGCCGRVTLKGNRGPITGLSHTCGRDVACNQGRGCNQGAWCHLSSVYSFLLVFGSYCTDGWEHACKSLKRYKNIHLNRIQIIQRLRNECKVAVQKNPQTYKIWKMYCILINVYMNTFLFAQTHHKRAAWAEFLSLLQITSLWGEKHECKYE